MLTLLQLEPQGWTMQRTKQKQKGSYPWVKFQMEKTGKLCEVHWLALGTNSTCRHEYTYSCGIREIFGGGPNRNNSPEHTNVTKWIQANKLLLAPDKTEYKLAIGKTTPITVLLNEFTILVGGMTIHQTHSIKLLGIICNRDLNNLHYLTLRKDWYRHSHRGCGF